MGEDMNTKNISDSLVDLSIDSYEFSFLRK